MKYTVTDPEHVKGGEEVEAETPEEAAQLYFDSNCVDVGVDDEVNFTISAGSKQWEVTIEVYREVDIYVHPITKTKSKKKRSRKP